MSSAGRSQEGTPATSDSAGPDDRARADSTPGHERDGSAARRQAATATAVVSPTKTDTDKVPEPPRGRRFGRVGDRGGLRPDKPPGKVRRVFRPIWRFVRSFCARVWVRHVALLLVYIGAGIAATWPRFTYLADGKLPRTTDVASFVWGYWWIAHQIAHLGNPFSTTYMAAPVGIQLGFSTLMPLAGLVMTPVTLLWGPSAAFTAVSLITPGLLCYTMFRAARLWLNLPGSIAAGAFFGLSSMMLWQDWYHINIAIGLIFLPVTIEAAVRLRRTQKIGPAIGLGAGLGAAVMTSQEGAAIALLIAAVILVPWILGKLVRDRASLRRALPPLGIGAVVAFVVASPQLIAMVQQIASGGAKVPMWNLAVNYTQFGVPLQTLFSPSPRLSYYGLGHLTSAYSYGAAMVGGTSVQPGEGLPTFGVVVSGLAILGLLIGWRKKATWWFALLWVGCALLALGTSLTIGSNCIVNPLQPGTVSGGSCHQYLPLEGHIHWTQVLQGGQVVWKPVEVSNLMPYTWLVRLPGLAGLREADRFALVGLIGVALLAGLVVDWISRRRWWLATPLLVVVLGLAVLETGWAGGSDGPPFTPTETMPTNMAAFDWPLKADHSNSIVLDVPWGLRGGLSLFGSSISERTMLLATDDGHPRAVSYTAWVPRPTAWAMLAHPFFRYLDKYQNSTTDPTPHDLSLAAADLKRLNIGWVIEWRNLWRAHHATQRLYHLEAYLRALGFRYRSETCLVPSVPRTFCGGSNGKQRRDEVVVMLKYVPADAYTGAHPVRQHHSH